MSTFVLATAAAESKHVAGVSILRRWSLVLDEKREERHKGCDIGAGGRVAASRCTAHTVLEQSTSLSASSSL
jgi:hypothetical protein